MLSGLLKFILGVSLAIAVLIGSGVAVALYFMNRTAIPPAKPIFSNDSPAVQNKSPKATNKETASSSSDSATPNESAEALPPGAYRGRVTWSEGLSMRAEPNQDAERIGGATFNQRVIILEESQDKDWQKIRLEGGTKEGWVKAGNIERVD
ncbi:SH3 domain-containing protein [Halotia branconii]|uniref:SH3 domain-containing protein n=1 Tax=Halotia branconii CENA392 TaxID=1539056 RepID=A0AAJ6NP63_9CYAN|nr:SH3 domain-containing protein [Halotia branconii]WGV23993.1 SH3 domain-containing protein [Halotia branconii CENA392]